MKEVNLHSYESLNDVLITVLMIEVNPHSNDSLNDVLNNISNDRS